jgi:hypothetical protein
VVGEQRYRFALVRRDDAGLDLDTLAVFMA